MIKVIWGYPGNTNGDTGSVKRMLTTPGYLSSRDNSAPKRYVDWHQSTRLSSVEQISHNAICNSRYIQFISFYKTTVSHFPRHVFILREVSGLHFLKCFIEFWLIEMRQKDKTSTAKSLILYKDKKYLKMLFGYFFYFLVFVMCITIIRKHLCG